MQHGSINAGSNASDDPLLVATSGDSSRVPNSLHGTWKNLSHQVKGGEFLLRTAGPSWDVDCEDGTNGEPASKHEKRQAAEEEIRGLVEFSLWQCLLAIFAYMAIAVLAFSVVFDHWTIIDSAYFAVVTFSTIGFGDLVPETYAGRVFTCFFALSGVAFLGIALGVVGNNMIEAERMAVKQAGEISEHSMMTLFSSAESPDNSSNPGGEELSERMAVKQAGEISKHRMMTLFSSAESPDNSSNPGGEELSESPDVPQAPPGRQQVVPPMQRNPSMRILREFVFVIVVLLVFASLISNDPGVHANWDIGTGLYFAISKYCISCAFVYRRLLLMLAATDLCLPNPSFRYNISVCNYHWLW
jgi:hypothetical protein